MPRFLGRDYYNDDFTARRELSARASLTVPRRFKEDTADKQDVSCSEIYAPYTEGFGDLQPFDHADVTNFSLEVSDEKVPSAEPLQWATRWKVFDGNYIEIVPSSNPESENSLFDSQSESVSEACVVEDVSTVPLQWITKDEGYLEEPVYVCRSDVLNTSLPNLLKWSTEEFAGPPLERSSPGSLQDVENVSEDLLFGKSDLHLETSPEQSLEGPPVSSSSQIFSKTEELEQHSFTPAKAEELMCPVPENDSPTSSQQSVHAANGLVREAHATCTELGGLQCSPPLPPSVHMENGDSDDKSSMKELVKQQQPEKGLEKLVMSPLTPGCQRNFLSLNERTVGEDDTDIVRPCSSVMESPLHVVTSSPTDFEGKMSQTLLEPWSPEILTDHCPLLNTEGFSKLEEKLRYKEACFGNIQTVKFLEPQLHDPEHLAAEEKPNPVSQAIHLASSVHNKASMGQVELSLTWDFIPPDTHHLSNFCPETLILEHVQPPTWKLNVEFEAVEAVVERELEKRTLRDTEKEDAIDNKSVDRVDSLGDGLSSNRNSSEQDDCRNVIHSEGDMKGEKNAHGISAVSAKACSKRSPKVTKGNTLSKTSPLESFTGTTHVKQKTASNYPVQNPLEKDLSDKQFEAMQNSLSNEPTDSTKSRDFLFKTLSPEKRLELLETPAAQPSKRQNNQETVKKLCPLQIDSNSGDGDKNMRCCGQQPIKGAIDPSQDASTDSPPARFDLQFDEEDLDLGSDSFDEITSTSPDIKSKSSVSSASRCDGVPFDPVDSFLMMRDARTTGTAAQDLGKGHSIVKPVEKAPQAPKRPHPGVITPMTVLPRSASAKEQRFLTVSLSGPYLTALQETCSQAEPHMDQLRTQRIVSPDASFLGLKPDYTRFLLKDKMTKLQDTASQAEDAKDEVYKCVAVVHALRLAAHMLMHCCLESAIVHLGAMQGKHTVLTGSLEGLRKALFQCQFTAQQTRQLHPKVAAVCREIQQHKQSCPAPHKVVVAVRREEPTLLKTLQSVISLDGTVASVLSDPGGGYQRWLDDCECLLTWDQNAVAALVVVCTLVLEFEADPQSPLHQACQTHNVHYVGLSVQETQTTGAERRLPSADTGTTVVGSQRLIQNQQLLQLLETRHNIIVVRRDYASLGHIHYPDVVVNIHQGAVLVPVKELKEEGGLERVTERLAAVGLQLSTVWILLHAMGYSGRNVFDILDKDAVKKMVQLQALMANLSASAKGFTASYKVLLCQSAEDVALYLSHLTTATLGKISSAKTDLCLTAENLPLPPVEMDKEEKFLLGIPCLNPFRCQLLLSRATVGEVLTMSVDQLHSLYPELPESCLQNLHRVVTMDRGLQLRPHRSNTLPPLPTADYNNQNRQRQPLPDSSPLHHGQDEGNGEPAVFYQPQPFPPVTDDEYRGQDISSAYLYQDTARPDHASHQVSLPNVPSGLSKSLHFTDQPTPYLLPDQRKLENVGTFQNKNNYTNETRGSGARLHTEREPFNSGYRSHIPRRQGFGGVQSALGGEYQQQSSANRPEYFQEKTRGQTCHESEDVGDPHEYTPLDYQSFRSAQGYPVSSYSGFSKDRQRPISPNADLSDRWGKGGMFSCSESGLNYPSLKGTQTNREINNAPLLGTSHSTSFRSTDTMKHTCTLPQTCQQNRFDLDQRRMFGMRSCSQTVGYGAADLYASDGVAGSDHQFSSPSKYLKTERNDPIHSSSSASNQPFTGLPSDVELEARMTATRSDSHPENYQKINSQWNKTSHWSSIHGREKDENESFQRPTSEMHLSETYLQRSQAFSVGHPLSSSRQATVSDTWKPLNYSASPIHHVTNNLTLSSGDPYDASCPAELLRGQTSPAERSACYRDPNDILGFGNVPAHPAHSKKLTSAYHMSSSENTHRSCAAESSTSCYGEEDTREAAPTGSAPPHPRPSFCEDLAATTRRLLQGRSPFGGSHHLTSRASFRHRVSVGLAQPLRREDFNLQDREHTREHLLQPASPKILSQQSMSPPLDMDWESSTYERNLQITDTKLKKWSAHLQNNKKLECDSSGGALSGEEVWSSAENRRAVEMGRKLTYQLIPGAGGQTKLTFL